MTTNSQEFFMEKSFNYDFLTIAQKGANEICKDISLQKAAKMKENDVRMMLEQKNITQLELQDSFLNIVRLYEFFSEEMTTETINK